MTKGKVKEAIMNMAIGYWSKTELAKAIGVRRQTVSKAFDELVNDGYLKIAGIEGNKYKLEDATTETVDASAIADITSIEECHSYSDLLKVKGTRLHTFYNRERNEAGGWDSYHKPFTMYISKKTIDKLKEITDSEVPFF